MEPSPKRLCLSLEPLPLYEDLADDLFARPARLVDVNLESGTEVYSRCVSLSLSNTANPSCRDDPEKSISERLKRIWAERGDFSALTSESILAPAGDADEEEAETDTRPSAQEMRELQGKLMDQLTYVFKSSAVLVEAQLTSCCRLARVELTTALDLLSILAPPTDPPSVDFDSLPLPPQTLVSIPVVPRPSPATDDPTNTLPLATSLSSLRSSAEAFFSAADPLFPSAEDPAELSAPKPTRRAKASSDSWPKLLHLRSTTAQTLLPLGALRGASLTGKGETRAARQVGIFYGCEEAKEGFRMGAVTRVEDLGEEGTGRTIVVTVAMMGREGRYAWEGEGTGIEGVLQARGRSAFAEELFAAVRSLRVFAKWILTGPMIAHCRSACGRSSQGSLGPGPANCWRLDHDGWFGLEFYLYDGEPYPPRHFLVVCSLSLSSQIIPSSLKACPTPTSPPCITRVLLPLLRLLFLQEYAKRRSPSTPPWTRPILATLSVFLSHTYRLQRLSSILGSIVADLEASKVPVQLERFGSGTTKRVEESEDLAESVVRILRGDTELGGRAVLRLSPAYVLLAPPRRTPLTRCTKTDLPHLLFAPPPSASGPLRSSGLRRAPESGPAEPWSGAGGCAIVEPSANVLEGAGTEREGKAVMQGAVGSHRSWCGSERESKCDWSSRDP